MIKESNETIQREIDLLEEILYLKRELKRNILFTVDVANICRNNGYIDVYKFDELKKEHLAL
jgi:hypothetical protein